MPSPNRFHYRYQTGWTWKALAAASWAANLMPGGFLLSFVLFDRFPDRFMRRHAFFSGLVGFIWFGIMVIAYGLNYLFLYESTEQFSSYEQLLGGLFSAGPELPLFLIVVQSILFVQHLRLHRLSPAQSPVPLLLALGLPFILYNKSLWAPVQSDEGLEFFAFDLGSFRSPLTLLPGHFFTLLLIWGAFQALLGRAPLLYRRLFCRLLLEGRARGDQRQQGARLRALLPGWGFYYLGHRLAGITFFLLFLLILFVFSLSLSLCYGDLVRDWHGFNANAAWYYLSTLGLKSAVSDAHLKSWLGNEFVLFGSVFVLSGCVVLSRFLVARYFRKGQSGFFWFFVPTAALLHFFIPVMALLVPVRFLSLEPPVPVAESPPPVPVIPRFFEESEEMGLDGSAPSGRPDGDDRDPLLAEKKTEARGDGPGASADESTGLSQGEGKGFKGDRQAMTYSNYLSARLRVAESWLSYWDQVPEPYAAVFSYRILHNGVVENVSLVDPSSSARADQLTIQLIESMGVLLPPPEGAVRVTELFWNTAPDDKELPTELKRQLSRAFDGRVIERD